MSSGPAPVPGSDPAYDTPGDVRSILRSIKLIAWCLGAVLLAAAVAVPVPGLWGGLFFLLWVATLSGVLWGGWRAGVAILLVLIGTLFNLPLVLGEGGARYVVWEVGARILAVALSAWMAGWLFRRRSVVTGNGFLGRSVVMLLMATLAATAVALWLQRGNQLALLPVTILGLVIAVVPAALLLQVLLKMWGGKLR